MAGFHCMNLYDLGDFLLCDVTESCIHPVNPGNRLSCLVGFPMQWLACSVSYIQSYYSAQ